MKRGLISAVAALSLLSGSAAMAAGSNASALSLTGARASASKSADANALGGDTAWIGLAVFAAIVAVVFIVAEEDDNSVTPNSP